MSRSARREIGVLLAQQISVIDDPLMWQAAESISRAQDGRITAERQRDRARSVAARLEQELAHVEQERDLLLARIDELEHEPCAACASDERRQAARWFVEGSGEGGVA